MKELTRNYLRHLGLDTSLQPDIETLKLLHRLHAYKFPFENITPFLFQEVSLNEETIFEKMSHNRGGYCFEQNTLFAAVLRDLGFKVTGLGGRVLWNQPEHGITRRSHMLLKVTLPEGDYLADVGFGGLTLTVPLKFDIGLIQETTHELFRLEKLDTSFKMQAKVEEVWKTLYRFDLLEQFPVDFDIPNFYLYTHSGSIFRNTLMAALPDENGRNALNNNILSYYSKSGDVQKRELSTPEEVQKVLYEVFHIRVFDQSKLLERLKTLFTMKN